MQVQSAECGVRNCKAGSIPELSYPARPWCGQFRIPHSALRIQRGSRIGGSRGI